MHWGSGDFESPSPEGSLITGAFMHDTGWQEFDHQPRINADEKADTPTPINFHELPPQTWVDMYEQGIDTVSSVDPYAGLVVSLHGVGLQNRRYGLTLEWSRPGTTFTEFIRREQRRQRRLIEQIGEQDGLSITAEDKVTLRRLQDDDYEPERYDGQLWYNYKLLQTWDTLSHILCATADQTVETTIEHTPVTVHTDTSIEVCSEGANAYQVDPYPFSIDPLVISAIGRTVSEQTVNSGDESAIAREYFSNTEEIEFRIHS